MENAYKIVVAHPDDEIIFFNSVLDNADTTIICFGPSSSPVVSKGRERVKENFPLKSARFLWISESDVFDPISFPKQTPVREGLTVSRNVERYTENFDIITTRLALELDQDDIVFTHNPWGEYGHEEHVQVFNAVLALQERLNLKIFVSNYVSDKSLELMKLRQGLLSTEIVLGNPCQNLGQQYLDLYVTHDSWTWNADYIWPSTELFFRVQSRVSKTVPAASVATASPPMNILSWNFKEIERSKIRRIFSKLSPGRLLQSR